jgi:hypothetical protein
VYCWQHLKQLEGFRIKKEGLVTTRPREKDAVVTGFAPPGVAAFAHPSIRPNTRVTTAKGPFAKLKAIKDIPANTAVTVPAGGKIPSVTASAMADAAPPAKKKKLIKPYYDPKWTNHRRLLHSKRTFCHLNQKRRNLGRKFCPRKSLSEECGSG